MQLYFLKPHLNSEHTHIYKASTCSELSGY